MARRLVRRTQPEPQQLTEPPPTDQPKSSGPIPLPMDEGYVTKLALAFADTKASIKAFTSRAENMKSELLRFVMEHGQPDENGSLWLDVGDDIKLKRERRVTRVFNAEAAEVWAKHHQVWDEVTDLIPEHRELSEDKLLKLAWERAGEADVAQAISGFYEEHETWAFRAQAPS